MESFKVKRFHKDAILPTRAHKSDAGLDLYSLDNIEVPSLEGMTISTGVSGEFPFGYVGMVTDRSSMAKKGFKVAGGIIDAGYTGELNVVLRNLTGSTLHIQRGDRIAQLLIIPIEMPNVEEVYDLAPSERGNKAFGSSGR